VEGVGKPVEAERPGDGDDVAAIDDTALEAALRLDVLIEMHPGRVLEKARGELVLGLLDRLAVDVIDLVACRVIAPTLR
jgi:hypothetical protein